MDKPPAREPRSMPSLKPPLTGTSVRSEEAVAAVELQRVRGMMSGIAISSAITAVIVVLVRGEPTAMRIHAGALGVTAASAGACAIWFNREVAKWLTPAVMPGEVPAMLQEVAFRIPVQPSKRATVSPELEAVLAIALAKSPVHRFATAGELATALGAALDGKLDRALMRRADALLQDTPWGAWAKR